MFRHKLVNTLALILLVCGIISKTASGQDPPCVEELTGVLTVDARVLINGVYENVRASIPLGTNPGQYGTAKRHHQAYMGHFTGCDSGKVNCLGTKYPWTEYSIDENFQAVWALGMDVGICGKEAVEAFYNHKYSNGFTKIGEVDFKENCFGYAFGLGVWVNPGPYGIEMFLNIPGCYLFVDSLEDAQIAKGPEHAMKVQGDFCIEGEYGALIIVTRNEKDGVGPKFTKTSCFGTQVLSSQPYANENWDILKPFPE